MRILVIGASGLVGSHVLAEATSRGHTVVGTYRNHPVAGLVYLDLGDEAATAELVDAIQPDWIVHAAGWTWVDGCEKDPERAFRENCEQPAMLARLCARRSCRFAYFSTTYIFDGTAGPYAEDARPNPLNVYAKSKWAAEQAVQEILTGQALIPRVICVWGREEQQKNFVYQVLKALLEGRPMKLPSDQRGNPTWAGDIAAWLLALMTDGAQGVWNLAGTRENCSRVEWFELIAKGAGEQTATKFSTEKSNIENTVRYTQVPTAALGQPALRPLHAGAIIRKITQVYPRVTKDADDITELG